MNLFADSLNNIYTYECIYFYYKTGERETAYRNTVAMKTKLLYAIDKDYFLTEEERNAIDTNAEEYLRMQYDRLNLGDAYTPDSVHMKFSESLLISIKKSVSANLWRKNVLPILQKR